MLKYLSARSGNPVAIRLRLLSTLRVAKTFVPEEVSTSRPSSRTNRPFQKDEASGDLDPIVALAG